jgi:hypothetical protein
MDKPQIRPSLPEERLELEELQRRASLALETNRDQLEAIRTPLIFPQSKS